MRKSFFCMCACLLLAAPAFLSAQTAELIEGLLQTKTVTYDQAARFVLEAADHDPAGAFQYAMEQRWLPKDAAPDDGARLDGVSLLIMGSFDIKGGLFYSIFKNPHYAYRELVYREVIQGLADPQMDVSGDFLLYLIGRVFSLQEDEE